VDRPRIGRHSLQAGLEVHTAAEESYEAARLLRTDGEILRSEMPRLSFSRRVPAASSASSHRSTSRSSSRSVRWRRRSPRQRGHFEA